MSERLIIRGGTVVDGTGAAGFHADVAIEGDRIVAIGPNLTGDRVLDATGCVVAPGFIDIHTHYDAQVFWDPALTPSVHHGVTTVVAGNCGFSIAPVRPGEHPLIAATMEKVEDMDPATLLEGVPWNFETFGEYLSAVRDSGTVLNYAAFIGHTALRLYAMGDECVGRVATPDEVTTMTGIVRQAMVDGAVGFATSFAVTHRGADGQPIPSRWADRAEIDALCHVVGEAGRGVVAVNGGENLSLSDVYGLQAQVGAPFTYTAVLTTPAKTHEKAIEIHRAKNGNGAVWPQVTCRPLSFSMTMVEPFTLNTSPVFAELMPKSLDERRDAYADSAWRDRVREHWNGGTFFKPRWETYEVMESAENPDLIGRRIADLAEQAGQDPLDCLLDLALAESDLKLRVKAVLANDDPDGITMLLQEPGVTLGLSDAGAHVGQLCDAPQATDLLGGWVRDRGVLSVERAVRMLSGQQADLFGFADRGYLRVGSFADVVVFDPATVAPGPLRRVRDFPANGERLTADQPVGMRHLVVNGTVVRRDGALDTAAVAAKPGRVLAPAAR